MSSAEVVHNRELALLANEELWNRGNFNKLKELFAEDFVGHFLPFGTRSEGLEALKQSIMELREAFPDWHEAVNLVVAEGDYVVLHYVSTGTNLGRFQSNPPTEKKICINEMTIFKILDGKITEQWLLPDLLSLNLQLGSAESDT